MSANVTTHNKSQSESSKRSIGTGLFVSVLLIQQLLGALAFPIAKYGLAIMEPLTFAFYRFVISAVVLLAIVHFRKHATPISRSDAFKIVGLGILIIPFNQVAFLYGQDLTAVGHGSLLFATAPIWVFIAALIHLKEKFQLKRAIGVSLGLLGVLIIMTSGAIEIGLDYLIGDLLILMAVIAWAYYTILGKPLVEKYGAFRVTAYALASGSAMYFPFGLYRAITLDYSSVTMGAWLSVIYMAIGLSIGAYVLWYWLLKYFEASRIAVYHNIQPIIATVVAYFFLGETLGWSFVIGGCIVLAGVIVTEA